MHLEGSLSRFTQVGAMRNQKSVGVEVEPPPTLPACGARRAAAAGCETGVGVGRGAPYSCVEQPYWCSRVVSGARAGECVHV